MAEHIRQARADLEKALAEVNEPFYSQIKKTIHSLGNMERRLLAKWESNPIKIRPTRKHNRQIYEIGMKAFSEWGYRPFSGPEARNHARNIVPYPNEGYSTCEVWHYHMYNDGILERKMAHATNKFVWRFKTEGIEAMKRKLDSYTKKQ